MQRRLSALRAGVWAPVITPVLALALGCSGDIGDAGSSTTPTGPANGSGEMGMGGSGAAPAGPPAVADAPNTCGPTQLGVSPLHRLTRLEYNNTIRELLGEDMQPAREFTEDERAGEFSGNFFTPVTELQLGQYATAAGAIADHAVASLLPKLLPCDAAKGDDACAETFIRQFGRRAHRRPLQNEEVARYVKLFAQGRDGDGFAHGIKLVIEAMLQTPHFLYLVEGPGPLSQHQLAARLSYFLWKAPPDAKLSELADAGKLNTLGAFRAEAKRLLADPRAQAMINDFHTQWLGMEKLDKLPKDQTLYPGFETLRVAMAEETRRFVAEVMAGDGKLSTLLTADYSVVNGPLAALYGASGSGDAWKKTTLDHGQRAGILTQGSFLSIHGALDGSSPIRRGLAVRERVLCAEIPPPPPGADQNVPPLKPSTTTRQRFDQHRTVPSCAGCHTLMDMLGYGFESYDGIGKYRTKENGVDVDDSGQLLGSDVDGPFKGARGLAEKLASSKQVAQCMTTQWFRYAFGRLETKDDQCGLDAISKRFADSNYSIPELLVAIVESDAFRTYRGQE